MRREWLNFRALWVLLPALGWLPASAAEVSLRAPCGSLEVDGPVMRVRLIDPEALRGDLSSLRGDQKPNAPAGAAGGHPMPSPLADLAPHAVVAHGVAAAPAGVASTSGPGAPRAGGAPPDPRADSGSTLSMDFATPTRSVADERAGAADDEVERPVFQVRARVLARGTADERRNFERRLSLSTGELGATASLSLLEAELTADFADKAILKDAYVRLSTPSRELRLYGGQFKSPFLARRLMSRWDLPTIERGLVADYLIDDHGLGGRRLGLMGEWRAKSLWNLRASLGVFEGGEDELGIRTGREDASGRVAIRPIQPLTLGASGYLVSAFDGAHRAGAGAVDATLKLGSLQVAGEATAGRIRPGDFTALSVLGSWALPLDPAGRWAVEPVLGAETLQLLGPEGGTGWAYTAGVNLLFLDAFKAMVQGEHALRPGDPRPAFALFFQLATQLSLE